MCLSGMAVKKGRRGEKERSGNKAFMLPTENRKCESAGQKTFPIPPSQHVVIHNDNPDQMDKNISFSRIKIFHTNRLRRPKHMHVIQRIKENPLQCKLLVILKENLEWYKKHNVPVTLSLLNVWSSHKKKHQINECIIIMFHAANHIFVTE
ncbi:hypothetical protein LOAG_07014 [Loa loa]|uniref:Uncharacterized protein n=1 Tax=Loa loa TaxID=7209 RepID=A0A1S0TWQ3_LOALO|nr:hypothetical protein LOAG_07014 [Loa loa]EFO21474.1 hypothetical protein LOAG_07014 [Loa loa]